jgi:hypothetical protein
MKEFIIANIKKKSFFFFLQKLVILFSIIFILDLFVGNILEHFYFKQNSGLQYRTTYSIEKTEAEILIFGSSRANHHYNPAIFEKRLNLSFYNVGRDGNYIFYHLAVLRGVLKRYSPRIVILDFVSGEFKKNRISYDRLSTLLPYYKKHPEMQSIINLKSKYEKLKMLSNIYPYNSSIFTIAIGNTEFNKNRSLDFKGYIPLTKTWNGPILIGNDSYKYNIDSIKIKAFESFIQDCSNSKAKLYIVCSPYLINSTGTDYSLELARKISKKFNIEFFDFSHHPKFITNPKLFADVFHLNEVGSKIFSNIVIDSINKQNYLLQSQFIYDK